MEPECDSLFDVRNQSTDESEWETLPTAENPKGKKKRGPLTSYVSSWMNNTVRRSLWHRFEDLIED